MPVIRYPLSVIHWRLASWSGVTLLELLVVLIIIGLLATAAVRTWDVTLEKGRYEETIKELEEIARSIVGDERIRVMGERVDFGFVGDCGMLPRNLIDLSNRPEYVDTGLWRGPYIKATFAENPRSFLFDAWGDSYVYNSESLFIRSFAGQAQEYGRGLTKKIGNQPADFLNNTVSGYVEDAYGNRPTKGVSLYIIYPWQGRLRKDSAVFEPHRPGQFAFSPIPQGKVRLISVLRDTVTRESIDRYITVYPKVGKTDLVVRFNSIFP